MTARYQYGANYLGDRTTLRQRIAEKTIAPHQVEWQPGPPGQEICWLDCPYCYGRTAAVVPDRLPLDRALDVLGDLARGPEGDRSRAVRKLVFAGYATDPLYSRDCTALVTAAVAYRMVVGFNTKLLHIPPKLLAVLPLAVPTSWVTVSVDAGSDGLYNRVHAVQNANAFLYSRVLRNIADVAATGIEVSASYLMNEHNGTPEEVCRFLDDVQRAGVRVVRFSFAQMPRGGAPDRSLIPSPNDTRRFMEWLPKLAARWDTPTCRTLVVDDQDLFRQERTLPCVARWVYPTVGYDGWLYPCSQTGAPTFREIALGNLATDNFWDLYYTYNGSALALDLARAHTRMAACDCRCDRKEHIVNLQAGAVL